MPVTLTKEGITEPGPEFSEESLGSAVVHLPLKNNKIEFDDVDIQKTIFS